MPKNTLLKAQKIATNCFPLISEANNLFKINEILVSRGEKGKVFLYALYMSRSVLLHMNSDLMYIGITNNLKQRIFQHYQSDDKKGRFSHVKVVYTVTSANRNVLAHAEALLISGFRPPLNVKFNPFVDRAYKDPKTIKMFIEK